MVLDRADSTATITIRAPEAAPPATAAEIHEAGTAFWPFALARELDDAIIELRLNEQEIGTWVFRTEGDPELVAAADKALLDNAGDWLVREITLYLKRVLKRIDVSSRSLIALVEPATASPARCSNSSSRAIVPTCWTGLSRAATSRPRRCS